MIGGFLTHLEVELAAQHRHPQRPPGRGPLPFAYAAVEHPEHAGTINRVMAIPAKRRQRRTDITYLTEPEVTASLRAPDPNTPAGRRDHAPGGYVARSPPACGSAN